MSVVEPIKKEYRKLNQQSQCTVGCDPELFIRVGRRVVGSEKAIPDEGLDIAGYTYGTSCKIIQDGVQVELNPAPNHCRANLGNDIKSSFLALKKQLDEKGMKIDMRQVVKIQKKELESLSENNRQLGCGPSLNLYGKEPIKVNPKTYRIRSAGGHLHFGILADPKKIVPLFDFFVGNTCVRIDRDMSQLVRRLNYGRASEHRLPPHGIEYRTLSNFWLRSYPLMSLVMGLGRIAHTISGGRWSDGCSKYYEIVEVVNGRNDVYEYLMDQIDLKLLERAINKNDDELAIPHYLLLKQFVEDFIPHVYYPGQSSPQTFTLWPCALPWFDFFIQKGLDHWWPNDPMKNWCNMNEGHGSGWENYLNTTVRNEYEAANKIV